MVDPATARRKALALLVALGLALVAAELLTRWRVPPITYAPNLIEHPELGWIMRPGLSERTGDARGTFLYETGSEGFRGPEIPPEGPHREPGVRRLLFLGDSFLNAWAVREEERLQERTSAALVEAGIRNEAFTLSCDGYGTMQELLLLRRFGERVAPDDVVLVLFTGNDVMDDSLELAPLDRNTGLSYVRPYAGGTGEELGTRPTYPHPARSFLRHRSRLFRLLEKKLYLERALDSRGRPHPWPNERLVMEERVALGMIPQEYLGYLAPSPPDSPWGRAWATTEGLVRATAAEARSLGARFLVLVIPAHEEVLLGAKGRNRDALALELGGRPLGELVDWNLPARRLEDHAEAEGLELRSLVGPFRAETAARPEVELYGIDAHLLAAGHEVAARVLVDALVPGHEPDALPLEVPPGPVDLHAVLGEAALWQDFRERPSTLYAAEGWERWKASWGEADGGWGVRPRCVALLPGGLAPIVLRASPPPGASFPMKVALQIRGTRDMVVRDVEGPGELELVLEPAELGPADLERLGGSLPVRIFSGARGREAELSLLVHELGLRADRARRHLRRR